MRELLLKRLEEIKTTEKGFPTSLMRWEKFKGPNDTLLKDVVFEQLSDADLIELFERLVRRRSQMM